MIFTIKHIKIKCTVLYSAETFLSGCLQAQTLLNLSKLLS